MWVRCARNTSPRCRRPMATTLLPFSASCARDTASREWKGRAEKRMELKLPEKSLVVFVDDTGHEALVKGHPVYGLGGCAVMADDLERVVRRPWHEARLTRHYTRLETGAPFR